MKMTSEEMDLIVRRVADLVLEESDTIEIPIDRIREEVQKQIGTGRVLPLKSIRDKLKKELLAELKWSGKLGLDGEGNIKPLKQTLYERLGIAGFILTAVASIAVGYGFGSVVAKRKYEPLSMREESGYNVEGDGKPDIAIWAKYRDNPDEEVLHSVRSSRGYTQKAHKGDLISTIIRDQMPKVRAGKNLNPSQ